METVFISLYTNYIVLCNKDLVGLLSVLYYSLSQLYAEV